MSEMTKPRYQRLRKVLKGLSEASFWLRQDAIVVPDEFIQEIEQLGVIHQKIDKILKENSEINWTRKI